MMRKLGAVFFFLLAIAAGIALVVFWQTLGEYTVVLYSIHLPWLTFRAVVAMAIVGFVIRAVQLWRMPRPRAGAVPMTPVSMPRPAQPQNPQQNAQSPSDSFRF